MMISILIGVVAHSPRKSGKKEWGGGAQPQNAPGAGGRWGTFVFEVGGWA
jgi:hypothetical protein